MSAEISRRTFSKAALAGTAATAALSAGRVLGANDRVRVGFIGVGNRGCQVLRGFLAHRDAQVVALCDVYRPYLHAEYDRVDPRFLNLGGRIPKMDDVGPGVDRLTDFRRLIDRKDIDAIVVATPDHWHAIQTITACRAGKDVYCEKPLSITIKEGRAMVEAARKADRVVQVGTHRRSSTLYAKLAQVVQSGAIGKVTVARAAYCSNMTPGGIGREPDSQHPTDLDWDMWLGPRPARAFRSDIMPYKFRWWLGYSSQVANWGVHYFDLIRWLTGELAPASVAAFGGRFAVDDDRTVPDTTEITFEHASGMLTHFSLYEANGAAVFPDGAEVELRGTLGTIYANTNRYWIVPEKGGQFQDPKPRRKPETVSADPGSGDRDLDRRHARTFLDAVKSRTRPPADIEEGHRSTTMAHLANIAIATRARLDWDAQAERFTNCDEANKLLHYEYRKPWTLD
jgi:predicted dehydrogenase